MTTAIVTNMHKLTTAPRKPDDTVDKLDAKLLVDSYSKNKIVILKIFYHLDNHNNIPYILVRNKCLNYNMYPDRIFLHGTHCHTQTDNSH